MSDPAYVFVLYRGYLNPSVLGIYTDQQSALDEMVKCAREGSEGDEYSVKKTPLNVLKTRYNVSVVGRA